MKSRWTTQNIPDQSGKKIIITGANNGLGFSSAKALAAKGAHVIMAVRTPEKGEAAAAQIRELNPQAVLTVMACDVADLDSVQAFAQAYTAQHGHVDVLMNNAGIMMVPKRESPQGFETQFATNHLGHFALTGHLLDALQAAPQGSRVVNVSSLAARQGKMNFDDLHGSQKYSPVGAYAQSKLCNQLFTYALQRRLQQQGIAQVISTVAHPGGSNTNLLHDLNNGFMKKVVAPMLMSLAMSADQGALSQLYAAVEAQAQPGGYYGPHAFNEARGYPKAAKIPRQARSQADQDRLWAMSEEMSGIRYLS